VGGELGPAGAASPGTVLEVAPQGARIGCTGGSLWIRGLVDPERPDFPPQEIVASLRVGDALS
jgi:hypothetical protein